MGIHWDKESVSDVSRLSSFSENRRRRKMTNIIRSIAAKKMWQRNEYRKKFIGRQLSSKWKQNISKSEKVSQNKLSVKRQNSKSNKLAWKEKRNTGMTGKHHTEKTKQKIANSHKGKKLTNRHRKNITMSLKKVWKNKKFKQKMSEAHIGNQNGLGYKHTKDELAKMSKHMTGKLNPSYGIPRYPKLKYIKMLKHYVRSSWEENVFRNLKENNINYRYEPKTFELSNETTYTPDAIINNTMIILEIKGPLFDWQVKKMKLFTIEYPEYKFVIICNKTQKMYEKLSFADKLCNFYEPTEYIDYLKQLR